MSNEDPAPSPVNSFKSIGRKLGLDCCFPSAAAQPIEFYPVSLFSADYKSKDSESISGSHLSLAGSFSSLSDKFASLIPKSLRKSKSAFFSKKDSERSRLLGRDPETSSCSSSECSRRDDPPSKTATIKMDAVRSPREALRKSTVKVKKTRSARRYRTTPMPKSPVALFSHREQTVTIQSKRQLGGQCGDSVNIKPPLMAKDSETGMASAPKEMAWTAHTPPPEFLNRDERKLWNQMTQLSQERFNATVVRLQQYFATVNEPKQRTGDKPEEEKTER